jgi:quinol monooxygenase YgiN
MLTVKEIAMTSLSLFVELKAKPGKEEDVANFLSSARELVMAEPETLTWFAVRFDRQTFAIFDAFEAEGGREAHLNGKVAEALMARSEELFAAAPVIRKSEVLADKLP